MDVNMQVEWIFRLSPAEAALILRALRGQLRDESDVAAAAALCDALTMGRDRTAMGFAKSMANHAQKVAA